MKTLEQEFQTFITYRDQLMTEYERYALEPEERLPFLDTILRLNETITHYRSKLRAVSDRSESV